MAGSDEILKSLLQEESECSDKITEFTERLNRVRQMIALRRGEDMPVIKSQDNIPVLSQRFANTRGLWPGIETLLKERGGKMKRDDLFRDLWSNGAFINAKRPEKNFQLSLDTQIRKGTLRVIGDMVSLARRRSSGSRTN